MPKKKPKWRSKFEKAVADQLTNLKIPYEYEANSLPYTTDAGRNYSCTSCGHKKVIRRGSYTPDFRVASKGKLFIYVESKGKWLAKDRVKMLAVIEQHPKYKFYMVFMRDNKINKNSKTRYSDFCEKNGIEYSIGLVKKEWFK